jgi:ATP:cob(I)alamin adenosyltransferase
MRTFRGFSSDEFKIYTRTGDSGTSQLFTGERRPKTDCTFDALGATDELNSHLGVARELAIAEGNMDDIADQLEFTMSRLFDVGAAIATPLDSASASKASRAQFDHARHTTQLEEWIDTHTAPLPVRLPCE